MKKISKHGLIITCVTLGMHSSACNFGSPHYAELVPLHSICPTAKIDLVWATGKNEFGMILYPTETVCYLHKDAAYALNSVQKDLNKLGYSLKILEGYRPLWAQQKIWNKVGFTPPTINYGRHTLGTAVDVTIVQLPNGNEIPLPPRHGSLSTGSLEEQQRNYIMLRDVMMQHGFEPHDEEWFHFDYSGWQNFAERNDLIAAPNVR